MRRLLLVGVLAVPLLAGPAAAASDPTTGYWTKTRLGAPVPVQPPDPAPEGGMWVSGDPSGPMAVSAVRAGADDGNVVLGLRLTIADAVGPAAVIVCPAKERWAPEQGGRLEAAPAGDCSAPVQAVVEEDVLVVELPALLQTDVVDLLLSPAPDASFSMTFERVTAEAVVQGPAGNAPMTGVAPLPPSSYGGSVSGPALEPGFSAPTGDLSAPVTAGEPLLPPPALPAPAEAAVPQPQAAAPPAPPVLLARQPALPEDRNPALMAVALLAGLGALAVRLGMQPAVAPRHLGGGARLSRGAAAAAPAAPVAVTADRGVGRFRGPRVRPPVRI